MKPSTQRPALGAYRFVTELQTLYTDEDFHKHINNVAVARYLDEARHRFSQALLAQTGDISHLRLVTAQANISFLAELSHPATLQVGCAITRIGSSSYEIGQGLFQGDRYVSSATTVIVNTGREGARPLTDLLRKTLVLYTLVDQTAES